MKKQFWIAMAVILSCYGCGDDSGSAQVSSGGCGDGVVSGDEACDDGNTESGDGCASDCLSIEDGYTCLPQGGECTAIDEPQPSGGTVRCGDGLVSGDEACDDGNTSSGDGCTSDCKTVEEGYTCPPRGGVCSKTLPKEVRCGDGVIGGDEVCDDGNTESGDGCASDCLSIEEGYVCSRPGYACTPPQCGDGSVQAELGETCDEGLFNYWYGKGICGVDCKPAHYCGDGLLDQIDRDNGEVCDLGERNGTDEYGGCSSDCQFLAHCGDGIFDAAHEACDDGNTVNGDGCSSECKIESGYACVVQSSVSVCTEIPCGNGSVEADKNETCDDGNKNADDGCSPICQIEKGWKCEITAAGLSECIQTCGNGILDEGEACDDGNVISGDGCSSQCVIEPGYLCDEANRPCFARACGDGILAGSETCDDGNAISGDGCSKLCQRETGYTCDKPGELCKETVCGDGHVQGDETCDEGGNGTEGCRHCQIVMGWECKTPGASCTKTAVFGDGILQGAEQCDEGHQIKPENKTEGCQDGVITDGWRCPTPGEKCLKGACGNGILEKGEACDDGNLVAGDGCSPVCQREPVFDCTGGVCKPVCGDGIVIYDSDGNALEECDDGNNINGDGCSAECKRENGFSCTNVDPAARPEILNLPVVYRDFRAYHTRGTGNRDYGMPPLYSGPGYFTEAEFNALPESCRDPELIKGNGYRMRHYPAVGTPIPDFQGNGCYSWNRCANVVYPTLSAAGRPMLRPSKEITKSPWATTGFDNYETCAELYTCPEIFDYWYKDSPMSLTIPQTLKLTKMSGTTDTYQYTSSDFWPLDGKGFHAANANELYSKREEYHGLFTTHFQSYFRYNGGETFTFSGDDDVWVYFNGQLVMELAGIHGDWQQRITFKKDGEPVQSIGDSIEVYGSQYGMYPGGIYDMQMFHAERCQGGSRFTLTLAGFVNMGASTCASVCGDGLVRGAEACDPGPFAPGETQESKEAKAHAAGCSLDCKLSPYCGNGKIEAGEECDTPDVEWCKNCKLTDGTCGNGVKEGHEECDENDGVAEGQTCSPTCRIEGCGDGIVQAGESCDDGNAINDDGCSNKCELPACGDGIVQSWLGEVCDDGKNDGSYNGCGFGCSYIPPRCGDGIVDALNGEICDDGVNNGAYGTCNSDCQSLPEHCGDGIVQAAYEQCDEGAQNGFGSCSSNCMFVVN